jgi:hypothetical protein
MKIPICTADHHLRHGTAHRIHVWHLHRGTAQWFICGPGPAAMLACSAPDYTGRSPKMTDREKRIAHKAIEILEANHRENTEAGPKEIQHALTQAARR